MNDQDKIAYQAEIDRLTKTIAWYQGQAGQRIGEAARAGIAGTQPSMPTTAEEVIAFIGSNYDAMHERGFSGEKLALDDVRFELIVHDLLSAFSDARDFPFEFAAPAAPSEQAEPSLRAALERIARWHGEFPEVTCSDGTVTSYGAAYGSNGQRDYMRQVASDALALAPAAPLPEQTGPSVEDDPEFDDLIGKLAKANASSEWDEGKACREWRDELVAYIDSRLAASPSPAPAKQQEPSAPPGVPEDCVAVPVKTLSLAVITLAHASSGNPLYDEAYNELSRIIEEHRTSKESVETAAPGASTEDKQ